MNTKGVCGKHSVSVLYKLHGKEERKKIGEWLRGSRRYFLQNYRDSRGVIRPGFTG